MPTTTPQDSGDRLTRLETALLYIEEDLKEARADIKGIKRSTLTTLFSILSALGFAIFSVIFRKLGVL